MKAGHFSAKIPGQLSTEINTEMLGNDGEGPQRAIITRMNHLNN
jgi:hypothetical protein